MRIFLVEGDGEALPDRDNRILVGGDTVQNDAIYMFGPGRSLPAYVRAIDKLEKWRIGSI